MTKKPEDPMGWSLATWEGAKREALEKQLQRERRQKAAAEMDALRGKLPPLDDGINVVEMLRNDRANDAP